MKMPVPADWDGSSTCDFKVTWPDSAIWRIILRGLLTNPSLAEFWDSSTGDVQQTLEDFQPIMLAALDGLECGDMNIPIGSIMLFAGGVLPDNWLMCDGSKVTVAAYPALYAVVGENFITGSFIPGQEFYLPDLRARVPVGVKSGDSDFGYLGNRGGEKTHTLTTTEIPAHTHTENNPDTGSPAYATVGSGSGVSLKRVSSTTSSTGGGGAHNNLQPFLSINFMIRAK